MLDDNIFNIKCNYSKSIRLDDVKCDGRTQCALGNIERSVR